MDTTGLITIVRSVVLNLAGKALNGHSYFAESPSGDLFAIIDISQQPVGRVVSAGVVVRIDGIRVIIERDQNMPAFVDDLIDAGIPREHIVLAYAGETP